MINAFLFFMYILPYPKQLNLQLTITKDE